jgi:hypothetical protein
MNRFLAIALLGLVSTALPLAAQPALPKMPSAVPLFDGKTFKGWDGDTNKTWRIVDGAIVGGSLKAPIARNEFLCTTQQYSNFILRLKFKLVGGEKANGGVQIRTERIPDHHEVKGYQADLGEPDWWGAVYDESRRKRVLAKSDIEAVKKVLKKNDWNDYTIRADGRNIVTIINGVKAAEFTEDDSTIPNKGIIGVQIHSGPASEAWYKDISIMELP